MGASIGVAVLGSAALLAGQAGADAVVRADPRARGGAPAAARATVGAEQHASRVVDRTFSCESGFVGGLRQVGLGVAFSVRPGSSKLRAASTVTRDIHEAALAVVTSDGITVHRQRCLPARGAVELTTKRMRGGVVPPLGAEATCATQRRVLLRVRAVFRRPVTPRTERAFGFPQIVVSGAVVRVNLAIGSTQGSTIAYLSLTGAERARSFTVRDCKED